MWNSYDTLSHTPGLSLSFSSWVFVVVNKYICSYCWMAYCYMVLLKEKYYTNFEQGCRIWSSQVCVAKIID